MKKKTYNDVIKFLKPLYKKERPFVIQEKDYRWINDVMSAGMKDTKLYFWGEPIYLDTVKTKIKPSKIACRGCGKTTGTIKFYIIADNMEEPKAYHKKCIDKLHLEVLMNLSGIK